MNRVLALPSFSYKDKDLALKENEGVSGTTSSSWSICELGEDRKEKEQSVFEGVSIILALKQPMMDATSRNA